MRAPQPRTPARLTLTSAWLSVVWGRQTSKSRRRRLLGMVFRCTMPSPPSPSGKCFWTDGQTTIVPGTNFARCRCRYRPRRGNRGALLGKAETVTSKHRKKPDTRSIWIVVAAFNEAAVLNPIVSDLVRRSYRVVVVDDGSHDATAQVALSAGATVVTHPVNLGQGAALQTGIKFALQQGAGYVVTFDADGQHRPSDIARLIDALIDRDAAYALGSRFLGSSRGMPLGRRLLLQAAVWLTRILTGLQLT